LDMYGMFQNAQNFNSSILNWTTSKVTDMRFMFSNAREFNSDISLWDTSRVTGMAYMFSDAKKFNSDISNWNTSSVLDMSFMFEGAEKFNQSLTNWCVKLDPPYSFATGSPLENNPAFQPLWNGIGCENKCYNGIRNTSDYSCTCDPGFYGSSCEGAITTTLTSTSTSTLTSTSTSTLTSTSTSSQPNTATDNNRIYLIIGLVLGAGTLLGLSLAVYFRCKKSTHTTSFNVRKFKLASNQKFMNNI